MSVDGWDDNTKNNLAKGDTNTGFGARNNQFGQKSGTGFGGGASNTGFGSSAGFGGSSGSAGFGGSKPTTGFGGGSNGGSGFGGSSNGGSGFGGGAKGSSGFGGGAKGSSGFGDGSSGFGGGSNGSSGFGGGSNGASGFGGGSKGFGGGSSGFGQSSGFGDNAGSGFGGGSGGGGSRACHNCNEEGHMSRDCPQPKKFNGTCFNCQQQGHSSRDCTQPRQPRSNGESGGFSGRDGGNKFGVSSGFGENTGFGGGDSNKGSGGFGGATSGFGDSSSGFGGGTSSGFGGGQGFGGDGDRPPQKCFNCRQEGHMSADCPNPPRGCFNCNEAGHSSKDCPHPPKPRGVCYNCNQEGHNSKDCTEPPSDPNKIPAATYIPEDVSVDSIFQNKTDEGALFLKFFEAAVNVTSVEGAMRVQPVMTFPEANLTETLRANVAHSGYNRTTPVQQYSFPLIAEGHDIMACAQTGSGKTAAFLLPIMSKLIESQDLNTAGECGCYPRCIILTPTRELADQIYNEGRKFSYNTIMTIKPVYGGTQVSYSKSQLGQGATILVGTVGRLKHFIQEGVINLSKVQYVVMDEADRMIDAMGFGDDIQMIMASPNMPPKEQRQTLMFSATFPESVQTAASSYLRSNYVMVTIDKIGAANKCVIQEFINCDRAEKKDKLLQLLGVDLEQYKVDKDADVYNKKTIVFVSQKKFADTLGTILSMSGIPAMTIHGDRQQCQRAEALRMFRNGSKPVLIATAVAERGLDIKGVDHVINYDLPNSIDDYVHRIGRTGRVGHAGRATSFVSDGDSSLLPGLYKILVDAEQIVPDFIANSVGHGNGSRSFGGEVAKQEEEDAW